MKCVFSWLPEKDLKLFFQNKLSDSFETEFIDKNDKTSLLKAVINADVLVGWKIDKEIIEQASDLKYLFYPGAGIQHINDDLVKIIKQKKITFCNSHGNHFATAEHAIGLVLALSNKLFIHHHLLKTGQWRSGDQQAKSISLKNKKVGILGFGKIGQQLYRFLKPFQTDCLVYKNDNIIPDEFKENVKIFSKEKNNLNTLLEQVDILICTLPETDDTIDLINKEKIDLLKNEAMVINVGRGKIINEKALYIALKEKKINSAAIDVWYDYKPEADSMNRKYPYNYPFHELDNIILSPHRAASPMDDPQRFNDVVYNINELVKEKPELKNIINDFDYR